MMGRMGEHIRAAIAEDDAMEEEEEEEEEEEVLGGYNAADEESDEEDLEAEAIVAPAPRMALRSDAGAERRRW